jgi:hypothetical protein
MRRCSGLHSPCTLRMRPIEQDGSLSIRGLVLAFIESTDLDGMSEGSRAFRAHPGMNPPEREALSRPEDAWPSPAARSQ